MPILLVKEFETIDKRIRNLYDDIKVSASNRNTVCNAMSWRDIGYILYKFYCFGTHYTLNDGRLHT